jgi:hypothetical protein
MIMAIELLSYSKNIKTSILLVLMLFLTACKGGGGGAIDDLFGGGDETPILTSIPDQSVSQQDLLFIDVNNIKESSPGTDEDMSYTCTYDSVVDGVVATETPCTSIPNSTVTFNASRGELEWTPNSGILGNFEIKIRGSNANGFYDEIFTVSVRLKFNGIGNITSISGTTATMTWTPNTDATSYQAYLLNSSTGQYQLYQTIAGGGNSGMTLTGLSPNTGYTVRVQAIDVLGNPDGNVVSKTFTTTELIRFAMSASATSVAAGTPTTITITAYNADGSPQTVGGVVITPTIASGSTTGLFSAVTDNNNGTYTYTFTPQIVGTNPVLEITTALTFFLQNNITLSVSPGSASSANSSLNISSNSVVSNQNVTVTAVIRDAFSNPITTGSVITFVTSGGTSTGNFTAVNNAGNGTYTSVFTGITAGTARTIRVSVNATTLTPSVSITVVPGIPIAANSTFVVTANSVASGNTVTATATLRDINNNPVPSGVLVAFTKSGGTSTGDFGALTNAGAGVYTIVYTGLTAGTAQTLSITIDGAPIALSQNVTVIPGAAALANSSLSTTSTTVVSGNFVTITATLRDINNNPIPSGVTVTFTKTTGTSTGTFSNFTNQGNGSYSVRYNGVTAGTAQTIGFEINAVAFALTTTVAVNPGSPSATQSTIVVASPTVVSNNSVLVTATIRDDNNNTISSGYSIAFSKSGGTSTGTFSAVTNQGNGVYQVNYQGVVAGTAQTLGILVDSSGLGPTTNIQVLPGAPDSVLSTLVVSNSTVVAGQNVTVTATIKDLNNNPISGGILVTFAQIGVGTSSGTFSVVSNDGNGVYTATYTGNTAGTARTIEMSVNASPFGPTQSVQVLVGAPHAPSSSLVLSASTVASGTAITVTGTIRDSQSNPITNQYVISFDAVGGSSSGNFTAVNNVGGGVFTSTYTGLNAGTAQTIRVLADGNPIVGLTSTIQVVPGPPLAANSAFTISSSTVQSGTNTTLNITLRDLNNNLISSGATVVTFVKSGGTSDGTISAVTNNGNGTYTATYTATTQGTAQNLALSVNATPVGMSVNVTVTAGPPDHLLITVPTPPLQSTECEGPYTVTLQDENNNTTSSLSALTMSFTSAGSIHVNRLFSDANCNTTITNLSFGILVSTQQFYFRSFQPKNFSLTITPSVGTIDPSTFNITTTAVLSWIGTASSFTITGSGSATVFDDASASAINAYGVGIHGDFMYVTDFTVGRVLKFDLSTDQYLGWIGHIGSTDGISTNCASTAINTISPGWCTGGRSTTAVSTEISTPRKVIADDDYIYVSMPHRIARFDASTGAYAGWIGRITATAPPVGGQLATCAGATANTGTPGWCLGGSYGTGTGDAMFNNPMEMVIVGTNLYVADYDNHRIQRFNVATGAFNGWIGRIATQPASPASCASEPLGKPTPTWCFGGTAQESNRYQLNFTPPTLESTPPPEGFRRPWGLSSDDTYLYVGENTNARISRVAISPVSFDGWIGYLRRSNPPISPTTPQQSAGYTATWIQGGVTTERSTPDGMYGVESVINDNTYIYFTDQYHRVGRVNKSNGQAFRWLGRASSSPTGGEFGCSSTPVNGVTPGWCSGGNANRAGNTNGAYNNAAGVAIYGDHLYVADRSNGRIQKIDKDTGEFVNWIGEQQVRAVTWNNQFVNNTARMAIDDYSFGDIGTNQTGLSLTTNHLMVADLGWHRIKKHNKEDGSIEGYIGIIGTFPPTGPEDCVGYTSGMTPTWCTGGGRPTASGAIQGYNNPYDITNDGTYAYIANHSNFRVDKIRISDGRYYGWVGRIDASPTDGDAACIGAASGTASQGWCIGGSAQAGNATGGFNAPRAVHISGTKLYISDSRGRVQRYDTATGDYEAVIGHLTAETGDCTLTGNTADSWCETGTSGGGNSTYGGLNVPTGITSDATYLYVLDQGTHRIHRITKSTGAAAGFIARMTNATGLYTGGDATNPCFGLSGAFSTPGWCTGTVGTNVNTVAYSFDGGLRTPRGIASDSTYLYVADTGNNRIVRINKSTGAFAGWKGLIGDTTGMVADSVCEVADVGAITPTWCYGGAAAPGRRLGAFDYPSGIAVDDNYVFVHDGRNNRIVTIPKGN